MRSFLEKVEMDGNERCHTGFLLKVDSLRGAAFIIDSK